AKNILDEAKGVKDIHPNVGSAIAALSQREEQEETTKRDILERAQREQKFLKDYALRYFKDLPDSFAGEWKTVDGQVITITKEGRTIKATWSHEKKKNALSGSVTNQSAKIAVKSNPENEILGFLNKK